MRVGLYVWLSVVYLFACAGIYFLYYFSPCLFYSFRYYVFLCVDVFFFIVCLFVSLIVGLFVGLFVVACLLVCVIVFVCV